MDQSLKFWSNLDQNWQSYHGNGEVTVQKHVPEKMTLKFFFRDFDPFWPQTSGFRANSYSFLVISSLFTSLLIKESVFRATVFMILEKQASFPSISNDFFLFLMCYVIPVLSHFTVLKKIIKILWSIGSTHGFLLQIQEGLVIHNCLKTKMTQNRHWQGRTWP